MAAWSRAPHASSHRSPGCWTYESVSWGDEPQRSTTEGGKRHAAGPDGTPVPRRTGVSDPDVVASRRRRSRIVHQRLVSARPLPSRARETAPGAWVPWWVRAARSDAADRDARLGALPR